MKKVTKGSLKGYISDDQKEIVRFVSILVIVTLFILGVYLVTKFFVKNDEVETKKETSVVEIDYNKAVFGTILNRPFDEYYVIAYNSEDVKAGYYGALSSKYSNEKDSLHVYFVDLSESINKEFVSKDGKTNPNAKNIEELSVGDITLIKVNKGKIVKYLENIDSIKRELNIN